MKQKTLALALILVMVNALVVNMAAANGDVDPKISFVGIEAVTGGTKFIYHVKAGSKPLNYWELTSCAFLKYQVLGASEHYNFPGQVKDTIRFTDPYNKNIERDVWFILSVGYNGLNLDDVDYLLKSAGKDVAGKITGPVCPGPDFVIPETSWGVIGTIAPMVLAVVILGLARSRFITFSRAN